MAQLRVIEGHQLTVLASLVLVVTKRTVESSELTELVALELVLAFRDGCGLIIVSINCGPSGWDSGTDCFNNVVNKLLGLVDFFFGICHNETVKIFFLVATVRGIGATLSFLDGAFTTNGNLGTRLGLHLFQGVSTRSYK
jgi:hypothetical protein